MQPRLPRLAAGSIVGVAASTALALAGPPEAESEAPVELGLARWQRDLDAAFATAKSSGKPLAVLFQEVPG